MVAGAAGDDVHVLGAFEDLGRGRPERRLLQPSIGHAFCERVSHRPRLLMDFLEHEVTILALLGRVRRPLTLANRTLGSVAILV